MKNSLRMCGLVAWLLAATLAPWQASAGAVRLQSGSVAFLKAEKQVNVELDFSDIKVGRNLKECVPEPEFVAQLNQKRPGQGDRWRNEWLGSQSLCQPKFQQLLNKEFAAGSSPLEFGTFKDAKYTLVLKTTTLLSGADLTVRLPVVSANAVFVETAHRTNTLAVVQIEKMPGQGFGPNLAEAYAKTGKDLGAFLRHNLK